MDQQQVLVVLLPNINKQQLRSTEIAPEHLLNQSSIMMTKMWMIILLTFFNQSIAMKVRERYLRYKSPGARCRIGVGGYVNAEEVTNTPVFSVVDSAHHALRHLNCTLIRESFTLYTIPEKNGTYDGYIGLVHRDEIDIGSFVIRPDTVPYEPGKVTPVIFPADIKIITCKGRGDTVMYDLTKFLDLGVIMYIYIFVTIFFATPLILTFAEIDPSVRRHPSQFIPKYLNNCVNMYDLIVDQEQFTPITIAGHMIALSASLFALFAIHGILLNTVGADLVVKYQPATIDSMDDLLVSNLRPLMVNNLFVHYILKASPPGSKENKLWLKMQEEIDRSLIKADGSNTALMPSIGQAVVTEVAERRAAYIGPDFFAHAMFGGSCLLSSSPMKMVRQFAQCVHISRQGFAEGVLTSLMSHKIHPYTEKIFTSVMTTVLETGLALGLAKMGKYHVPSMAQVPGMVYNSTTIECLDKVPQQDSPFEPSPLERMRKLLILPLISSFISCFILGVEMFYVSREKNSKKQSIPPNRSQFWARRVSDVEC